jgi:hypothetical protein
MIATLTCAAASREWASPHEIVRDPGPSVIALNGPWQFHTGDDPSFQSALKIDKNSDAAKDTLDWAR